jgi:superfamily II DNA or RNA helicase
MPQPSSVCVAAEAGRQQPLTAGPSHPRSARAGPLRSSGVPVIALRHVDVGTVEAVVGSRSFQRGQKYARGRVLRLVWDATSDALAGSVVGEGGLYQTEAYFEPDGTGSFDFLEGECSCPVGFNCKHVAAIVLAAVSTDPSGRTQPHRQVAGPPARQQAEPTWEESLQALLGSTGADRDVGIPLAIELTLEPGVPLTASANPRLIARVVRQGRRGWVNGGLSWGALDSWQVEQAGHPADQLLVLRGLHALHRSVAGRRQFQSYYSGGSDKTIDLAAFDRPLWSLLDEAERVGLRLLHAAPALGAIEPYRHAELCLDVTTPGGTGLLIAPTLQIEPLEADVVPVGFIGSLGHGLVYAARADVEGGTDPRGWRLGLARLATSASAPLREMVRSAGHIKVPVSEYQRFADEVWPRLRRVATVVSSDGSFTPPVISGPRLVLRASYGIGHALDLTWEWEYEVGTAPRRTPIDGDPDAVGYRDVRDERELVARLDVGLEQLGLLTPAGLTPQVQLTGFDTMRFTTEVLPLLTDEPGAIVEVTGQPADFRDVSDSLVIGLSTEHASGETDWFDLGITISIDDRELPFSEVFRALAAGEPHLLLVDGAYISLLKPELQNLRGLIDEARALQDQPSDSLRISRYQVALWDELCQLGVVHHQAEAWEHQVSALRAVESVDDIDVPATLTAQLRPYQHQGFGWLSFLWEYRLGGILADDMGLGKTLQALAVICQARQSDPTLPPFLVIAPTSVVPNWVSEAARFAPGLSAVAVTDTLKRSGRTIDEVVAGAHVVVTTYTLLRLDFEAYRTVDWAGLVLDEAQNVKNHRSKTYNCVRQLPVPFKLAITGTPMENNLMELWSLLSITAPGLFPNPARFAELYARPIERHGDAALLARFRRRIKPLVKRRTKELVAADLPAKQEQVLDIELHPQHRKIYKTHLQRERQKVLGLIDDFDRNRFTILRSLTLLRQLSLHPGLVDDARADVPCAKLDTLVQHIGEVREGHHRALVFSQFTGFLGKVRDRLDREEIEHCYLDGKTRNRETVLRRFKEGEAPVFLISLKAGGVGLNLTEADYCFLLDPWWNPATEAQAIDRTHRIGQIRNVMVYRLIARDTIEEKVMALKQRKADLFSGVMDDGDLFSSRLDADDICALFR